MTDEKLAKKRLFSVSTAKKIAFGIFFSIVCQFIFFAGPALANEIASSKEVIVTISSNIKEIAVTTPVLPSDEATIPLSFPENEDLPTARTGYYTATAYTSEVGQCDGSPCITANGFDLCEHGIEDSIAANFLPFGAKVKIPDLFGDRVFVVRDRMNKRYQDRIDIWMIDKTDAKQFGVRVVKVEILAH
jgi:3D (Asp-Asp-Asp) domain-containing protein